MNPLRRKNLKVVLPCIVVIGIMLVLVAYSPTLYRMFCAATGFGRTTQRADSDSGLVSEQTITVQFDSNVAPELPWQFEPVQREVKVHLGEQKLVFFTAENLSDQAVVGHASFNVTPQTTGIYFNKIQCFCFDDERLNAHEKVDMPVVFFVDPALANDPETRGVDTITLSYTFFRSAHPDNPKDLARFTAAAEPDPVRGQQLFEQRCAACHGLDINKAGPMLGEVFGRRAGSAAGYNYSPALREIELRWTADNLERWLTDPRKFKPGTRMPVRVIEPSARRDIITYLQEESRTTKGSQLPSVAQRSAESDRKMGSSPEVPVQPDFRLVGHASQ
jgi:cytochrome c oxidase assembly protein subunit 11